VNEYVTVALVLVGGIAFAGFLYVVRRDEGFVGAPPSPSVALWARAVLAFARLGRAADAAYAAVFSLTRALARCDVPCASYSVAGKARVGAGFFDALASRSGEAYSRELQDYLDGLTPEERADHARRVGVREACEFDGTNHDDAFCCDGCERFVCGTCAPVPTGELWLCPDCASDEAA
jgi:hypothetical protein